MVRKNIDSPRAGSSLRRVHANAEAQWTAKRRKQIRGSLWWAVPAVLGGGALGALATDRAYFGIGFGVLILLALVDVATVKPWSVSIPGRRASGEAATAKALTPLGFHGYTALHDRRLPPNVVPGVPPVDIEHLLIGPAGVFLLDSKNWSSGPKPQIFGKDLWVGREKRGDTLERLNTDAQNLTAALGPRLPKGLTVGPVMVIHAKELPHTPRAFGNVTVLLPKHVTPVFKAMRQVMTATEASALAASLDGLLAPKTGDRIGAS